ncbi:MAG: RES family NAD+ phosphorylase [Pleurocapsa sp.]
MFVWRICSQKYRASAFSGVGGLYVPGRWHPQGHKIVYTAESLALASLEIFVHLESDRVPLVAIKAWMSDELEIEEIEPSQLPDNWQDTSAYSLLQKMGRDWHLSCRTPILKVPSSIVPVEYNYLLNPQHPELKVVLEPPMKFKFDRRMWKREL